MGATSLECVARCRGLDADGTLATRRRAGNFQLLNLQGVKSFRWPMVGLHRCNRA